MAVSPKNMLLMKPLRAPTARIIPISDVRSRAAIERVLTIMIIATKKRNMTKTKSEALISTAILPRGPMAFFQLTARASRFAFLRASLSFFKA